MTEQSQGEALVNPEDTTVVVSRSVSKPVKEVWKHLVTREGGATILGTGAEIGEKGDNWQADDGTYGVIRSFHSFEQIRFSWHAAEDAPRTMVVLNLRADGPEQTFVELRHEQLPYYFDRAKLSQRWEASLDKIIASIG